MVTEKFELVTWGEVKRGDHVWEQQSVCVVTGEPVCPMSPSGRVLSGHRVYPVRDDQGREFKVNRRPEERAMRLIPWYLT